MTSLSSNPNPRDQQLQNNLRYESIQRIVAEYPSGEAQSLIERHIATYENELFELSNEKLINLYQALVFLSLDAQVEDPLFSRYVLTLTSCFCSYGMELPSDLIHERVQGAFVAKLGALLEAEQVEFSTFADAMLIAVVLCDDSFYLKEPFIASLSERIDGTARAGFSLDNLRFYVDQLDERVWELALSTNSLREKLFDSVCKNLTENIISP
ncbi:MAG: hypothetical protein KDD62_11315, partial [Bdellovibrionales bacterium]|nr:hypothetical protein [Bdellovibrionales bacterium]